MKKFIIYIDIISAIWMNCIFPKEFGSMVMNPLMNWPLHVNLNENLIALTHKGILGNMNQILRMVVHPLMLYSEYRNQLHKFHDVALF